MKISNKDTEEKEQPFAEMFRLQTEFQSRLADETLRYLRRLQGSAAPASPGTIVIPENNNELTASAEQGSTVALEVEIENLQRVHSSATPALSPLVSSSGVTWFPDSEANPATLLIPPDASLSLKLIVAVPQELPDGVYQGCVLLQGFQQGTVPVKIQVGSPSAKGGKNQQKPKSKRPLKRKKKS